MQASPVPISWCVCTGYVPLDIWSAAMWIGPMFIRPGQHIDTLPRTGMRAKPPWLLHSVVYCGWNCLCWVPLPPVLHPSTLLVSDQAIILLQPGKITKQLAWGALNRKHLISGTSLLGSLLNFFPNRRQRQQWKGRSVKGETRLMDGYTYQPVKLKMLVCSAMNLFFIMSFSLNSLLSALFCWPIWYKLHYHKITWDPLELMGFCILNWYSCNQYIVAVNSMQRIKCPFISYY